MQQNKDIKEFAAGDLGNYYFSHIEELFDNEKLRKNILAQKRLFPKTYEQNSGKELFVKIMGAYVEEAELTLSLLDGLDLNKETDLLEIGGGIGLVYGFLKNKGFCVYSLEPSASGYDGYYEAALEIFKTLDIDASNYYPLRAEESTQINKQFDVIFSNSVIEHLANLPDTFFALKKVLKKDGIMVHYTDNYSIPYDPHFKTLLIPFWPRATELLRRSLKENSLWQGINFVTAGQLKKICRENGLVMKIERGKMLETFRRFEYDPEFKKRQRYFLPLYYLLKYTRTLNLLNLIPPSFTTPIKFTVRHKQAS